MFRFFHRSKPAEERKFSGPFTVSAGGRISLTPEGAVFLHVETGTVFRSNRIGARIWQGVLDGRNQEAIADEISREYGAPREQVAQDTAQFLTELESAGFWPATTGDEDGSRMLLMIRVFWELLRYEVVISIFGFRGVYRGLRRLRNRKSREEVLPAVCRAVTLSARFTGSASYVSSVPSSPRESCTHMASPPMS